MTTRPATKAAQGWYLADAKDLRKMLEEFLEAVPEQIDETPLPIQGARIVIAPHAGYSYSGECAAWAYKALDLSNAKRVFVLGPSHMYFLEGCAMSTFEKYAVPLGELTVDQETVQQIKAAGEMDDMPKQDEIDEHSLEMHMPYLYFRLQETFGSEDNFPPIVPILVGSNSGPAEKEIGQILLPYLKDPENAFVISSDFCHWGWRFQYMPYSPAGDLSGLRFLRKFDPKPDGPPIYETIWAVDEAAMKAVEGGSHDAFRASLRKTKNTVCGRHPIGVMLAALELLREEPEYEGKGFFKVVRYERSDETLDITDGSSVSYVSAYATL